ncbi:Membrane-bound lytic murein transglycosylase D precursor [Dissulfuribacter thermophilus]|uniref:Membrane-bound lytic murein transglycosylase D n=1 Tax=Dissulfuribacter thermophilus TaxID=1156395 RepID=A0A1B9F2Z5_9BACT|nr:lytic transglycosylase domain-containing protein [Dissulfuribacter thermophilus]OCC14204.1 Membrane-bound lytic murein transglycosylase D precursor [Dissulfuribacter thermophilus]
MKSGFNVKLVGLVMLFLFFLTALGAGMPGAAPCSVSPDQGVKQDLNSVFESPIEVSGYPYQEEFAKAAARYGLPLPFVLAVARGESFFDPEARSAKGALGIMQIMPKTAGDYGVEPDLLLNPATNIDVGVHLLSDLHKKFKDPYLTLAAYYCGPGGVEKDSGNVGKNCDEYVRYIHSHLKTIVADAKNGNVMEQKGLKRFVLASFDNFLDCRNFIQFIEDRIDGLRLDSFRKEVPYNDYVRYQYQVLVSYRNRGEKQRICAQVQERTGFAFCSM